MGSSKRTSPGGPREELWFGSEEAARSRRWAYEELLFAPDAQDETETLTSLEAELASDLAELKRMQAELHEQVVRLAILQGQVRARRGAADAARLPEDGDPAAEPELRSFPSDHRRPTVSGDRAGALARCEGFRVDSPAGVLGIVDGLRFVSRIDEPDLLEVRGGRFGRELALIPVEAVDEISLAEERIVVRAVPKLQYTHAHEIVDRVRSVLHSLL
jgi:hypothetical protein